ncbi:MAG: MRP family ATP-binding protein [Calditrichaeota bacterium]|nr:MAG: MRP family ATP-binding protein [Calditrichota bacterium]
MSAITEEAILDILRQVEYPGYPFDIVDFGVVGEVKIQEKRVTVNLRFNTPDAEKKTRVKTEAQRVLQEALPDKRVMVVESLPTVGAPPAAPKPNDPWAGRAPIPGVKGVVAVASGKGGVGKSTVSTNLAVALAQEGLKIGLLDSDVYGPSIHIMMGVEERPKVSPEQKLLPIEKFGIKMMSMGFIIERDTPVIWRGPMVQKAVDQFLREVAWGELDTLIIDLPPGTGDVQLSLVQKTPLSGAIVVTTPQEVALVDARRGYQMFRKLNMHVFGIVENMSYYLNPATGEPVYMFGKGGGARAAETLGTAFLGEIPLDPEVTECGDTGVPITVKNPDNPVSRAFREIAQQLIAQGLLERVPR